MLDEELPQLGNNCRVHAWVLPTFRLPKTLIRGIVSQTVEAFCLIKIEIPSTCQTRVFVVKNLSHFHELLRLKPVLVKGIRPILSF